MGDSLINRHILLVAHGSRRQAANAEVQQLASLLQQAVVEQTVSCAFLEMAEPSIATALQASIISGADDIVIVPYFLANGRHVAEDIPAIVAAQQLNNRAVRMTISPYIGASDGIIELLLGLANKT